MHPDCFSLNKYSLGCCSSNRENDVTVRDVLDAFPLSRFGRYHLRFRKNIDDSYQWIEPQEVDGPCPIYNGVIFLKVLNLGCCFRVF